MEKYYINVVNGSRCETRPDVPSLMGGMISVDVPYIIEGDNVILQCLIDREINAAIVHVIGKKRDVVIDDVFGPLNKWIPNVKHTISAQGAVDPLLIITIPELSKNPMLDVEKLTEMLGELLEEAL